MALYKEAFWNVSNVAKYLGYDVNNGEVSLSDSEFEDILDELYEPITIMGMSYNAGSTLSGVDPTAFSCAKGDHESHLQSCLEDQLDTENDGGIVWIDDEEAEEG